MAANLFWVAEKTGFTVGDAPQPDLAVAANFERFDGLAARNVPGGPSIQPGELDHPAGFAPDDTMGSGAVFGFGKLGAYPRPGQIDQPNGQVYTEGPLQGVVGTLGGQPYPADCGVYSMWEGQNGYTPSKTPTVQWRLGVGQHGPSSLGLQNTVQLSEITNAPPVPGDLTAILAGQG